MARNRGKPLAICLLFVFLAIGCYAGYRLYQSYAAYAAGDRAYEQIAQQVLTERSSTKTAANPESLPSETSPEMLPAQRSGEVGHFDMPDRAVDFDALRAINPDGVAWLYCPDTAIDYPVMAADDYSYYLTHLPDGTYNINGSLFLDYGCEPDFSDQVSVIYGHNMKSGKMFRALMGYKKQSYYEEHPYCYLYTEEQDYRVALVYGAVISAEKWSEGNYAHDAEKLLAYAKAHSTFTSDIECGAEDRLLVLSTCSYEYDNARYFVVGVLEPA
jgi:sortase B